MENLNISEEEASKLASLSRGYGYGYQLLGHLYFERRKIDDELLFEYDKGLRMNSYEKIYSSVGETERKILATLIGVSEKKTSNVLIETGLNNKNYSVYRERLIQKGIILSPRNGYICLALPRFSEFLKEQIY